MDRIDDPIVNRFTEEILPILEREYRPALVIVFGSRARGDALNDSDLDLILVSVAFHGVPFLDRSFAVTSTVDFPFPVDLLCYTPEEFERKRKEIGTVGAAVEEGLVLVSR